MMVKSLFITLFTFELKPFHFDMSEIEDEDVVVRIDLHKDRCVLNLVQNVLIQGIQSKISQMNKLQSAIFL